MNKTLKTGLIAGGIAIILLIILPLALGSQVGWNMGCWSPSSSNMMGGLGFWWLVPLFWVAFIALVIWVVVSLVRGLGGTQSARVTSSRRGEALEILENRYASGEISKREFEAKKKTLLE